MSALIDKMNSLPKANTVVIGGDDRDDINNNEHDDNEPTKPSLKDEASAKPPKDEKPAPADKEASAPKEEQEPAANATKEQREAYKQRKLKVADEEKAAAKAEAEQYKRELEEARKEREEWKKQAQTVANRQNQPEQPTKKPAEANAPDISKDPVGFLAKGLDEVNNKFRAMEHQNTVNAAMGELAELEGQYASKAPDYNDVMKHAEDSEVAKMKLLNPNANEAAIRQGFKNDKVKAAAMFIAQGKDPVDSLYNLARVGYGYQPKEKPVDPKEKAAADKKEAEKARFDAVNKNKSKSATGLSAGGSSTDTEVRGPQTTKKRTLRDFAKLTKEQKDADYIQE